MPDLAQAPGAIRAYYEGLAAGSFLASVCKSCGRHTFPPTGCCEQQRRQTVTYEDGGKMHTVPVKPVLTEVWKDGRIVQKITHPGFLALFIPNSK